MRQPSVKNGRLPVEGAGAAVNRGDGNDDTRSHGTPETSTAPVVQLVNAHKAADVLDISVRQVWRLVARGKLPCIRIGGSTRFDGRDLASFVDSHRRTSGRRARG